MNSLSASPAVPPDPAPFAAIPSEIVRTLVPVRISGRSKILQISAALESLAVRVHQEGAMNWLGYFLGGAGARWKKPLVILFLYPGADRNKIVTESIYAAVVTYQLSIGPLPTRVYSTDDWTGLRTVVAPEENRKAIAEAAGKYLLERGAQVVLMTTRHHQSLENCGKMGAVPPSMYWAEIDRKITKERLSLEPTLEKTFSHFGKQTRFNLAYYRRRLTSEISCRFHPDVYQNFNVADIQELNSRSLNRLPEAECLRRIHATRQLNGGFLIGLSGEDEKLLSVLGGWRQGKTTVMHHQMNAAGYEKRSLVNVMRGFFLEHEISLGMKEILFYHGTNHPMHSAFESDVAHDLVICRDSMRARAMCKLARRFVPEDHYEGASYLGGSLTFLASVLASRKIDWRWQSAEG